MSRTPGRRRSLMTRLVASFLLLSVLMVGVVGVVAYLRAKSSLEGTVFDRLGAASELKADSLDRWIDEQRRNVVFVAGVLGGYETGESVTDLNADVLRVLDDPGERAAHESVSGLLSYVVSKTADAQEFLVLDLDGRIVVSTVDDHEGLDQSTTDYFVTGSSNTYVQPVATTDLSEAQVIVIATPLFAPGRAACRGRRGGPEPDAPGSDHPAGDRARRDRRGLPGRERRRSRPRAACMRSSPTGSRPRGSIERWRRPTGRGSTRTTGASP